MMNHGKHTEEYMSSDSYVFEKRSYASINMKFKIYFAIFLIIVIEVVIYFWLGNGTSRENLGQNVDNQILCSYETPIARGCICLSKNLTLISQQFTVAELADYIRKHRMERFECAMTFHPQGRLGNIMGEYATLYALGKLNGRPAILEESMAKTLRAFFKVSLPMLVKEDYQELEYMWTNVEIRRWMEPSYHQFHQMFIRFLGPPYSWTFYDHIREEILREFTFHEDIVDGAQLQLHKIAAKRETVTFVGVHVRRTDAIGWIRGYQGIVADKSFFRNAMEHFRSKYNDSLFVVASDDMNWCKRNIDTSRNDVHFVGQGKVDSPIHDFALLSSCNHSIISVGTYGYWTAYLAGGEVIYFANYTQPDSHYLKKFTYETIYLPNWMGISAERKTSNEKNQ